jgi:hypothetical protein
MPIAMRGAAAATKIAARSSSRFSHLNPAQVQQLHSSQRPSGGQQGTAGLHQLLKEVSHLLMLALL